MMAHPSTGCTTMAVTQADIDNLNAAIATGARSVTLDGQTVIYNTTASLIQARDDLLDQVRQQNAGTSPGRPRQTYAYYTGRGF